MFCPEYAGSKPLDITPAGWETRIFIFGPDSNFRRDSVGRPTEGERPTVPVPALSFDKYEAASADAGDAIQHATSVSSEDIGRTGDGNRSRAANSVEPTPGRGTGTPSVCLGTNLLTGAEVRWSLTVKGNPHLLVAGLPAAYFSRTMGPHNGLPMYGLCARGFYREAKELIEGAGKPQMAADSKPEPAPAAKGETKDADATAAKPPQPPAAATEKTKDEKEKLKD